MTKLILVRHGETEKNISEKLHQVDDPEILNERGRAQIKATALALNKFNPHIVYSSTEKRAQESAEILVKELGLPFKKIIGMQERNWGELAGKTWPEIKAVLDPMTLEERYNYLPPKGESWKEFEERLIKAISIILEENKGKTIVAVSHGGAIRVLMPYLLNLSKEESFKYNPDNASLTIFGYNGEEFIKEIINDTSHLKNEGCL